MDKQIETAHSCQSLVKVIFASRRLVLIMMCKSLSVKWINTAVRYPERQKDLIGHSIQLLLTSMFV